MPDEIADALVAGNHAEYADAPAPKTAVVTPPEKKVVSAPEKAVINAPEKAAAPAWGGKGAPQ
jgi:hypothetical protein